ncbi:MAG TPA: ion channel [Streptosporangiaceae bacterium]|jgi:hypothetical protein
MAQASLARRAVRRGSQPGPPETAGRDSRSGPETAGRGSRSGPEMAGPGSHPGPPETAGRYGVLLLVLISTYLLSAFSFSKLASDLQVAAFAAVLLLALRTSRVRRRTARLAGGVALIGSVAAGAADLTGTAAGYGAAEIWKALLLLFTVVLIVRRVLDRPTVTIQSIYGALSAYLIIGLMFAACYAAIEHLDSAPFFAGGQPAITQTLQYFSFTTLTTLGYGDFTAAGNGGRAIAVMEALTGQVFLATLVARLVAAFRAPAEQAQPVTGRPRPPRPVRRRPGIPYRGKPAGNTSRTSRHTRVPPARNHDDL